ncbi:MAG: FkbM family methyltransferase [Phycisphaeraceae bacterium]|nr:FkbM family methyltransferase [Phycisphaeraceae bacterium]
MPPIVPRLIARAKRMSWSVRTLTIRSGPAAGLRFRQPGSHIDFSSGRVEPAVQAQFQHLLRPGDVVYDIGSNYGFLAILAARCVGPGGKVIAFEPVPANAGHIRHNAAINAMPNIRVIQAAAASQPGHLDLILAHHPGGAVLSSAQAPPDASGRLRVETVTIDDLVANSQVPPPSLVKVDVEGAEFEVLAGMEQTLARHAPRLIVEFDAATEPEVQTKRDRFESWARERGYTTELLERSYEDSNWCVVHILATQSQ